MQPTLVVAEVELNIAVEVVFVNCAPPSPEI